MPTTSGPDAYAVRPVPGKPLRPPKGTWERRLDDRRMVARVSVPPARRRRREPCTGVSRRLSLSMDPVASAGSAIFGIQRDGAWRDLGDTVAEGEPSASCVPPPKPRAKPLARSATLSTQDPSTVMEMPPVRKKRQRYATSDPERIAVGGLIDEVAAAEWLGLAPSTLRNLRCKGGGPPFTRVASRCIRYKLARL